MAIWKRAYINFPNIPAANVNHGWTSSNGYMEPFWFDGDVLPKHLIDILDDLDKNNSESENEDLESDDDSSSSSDED